MKIPKFNFVYSCKKYPAWKIIHVSIIILFIITFSFPKFLLAKLSQNIWLSVTLNSYVHNVTKNQWYPSITNALANASNNNIINIYTNTFNENPRIVNRTNLTLQAFSFTNTGNNSNTIILGNVLMSNARKCRVVGFSIKNSLSQGVRIASTSTSNLIIHNQIFSNTQTGILITDNNANNNMIKSNKIFRHSNYGIQISAGNNNRIFFNQLMKNNLAGIDIANGCNNIIISNNYIVSNTLYGIYANEGTGLKINLNSIISNRIGLAYVDNTVDPDLSANNIYLNTRYNFSNVFNVSEAITNNWWGSTKYTNISSKIFGSGMNSIHPYRLFGPFNIRAGADVDYLPRVTWATAYTIGGNNIVVKWKPTTGGDFVKYNVYRTTNQTLWSNLTYNDVMTQMSPISRTNMTNFSMPVGTYYYYITAMDDPSLPVGSVFTNECWYSPLARVTTTAPVTPNVWNITKGTYHQTIMSAVSNANNNNVLEVITTNTYNERILLSPVTTLATNITIGTRDWWTNHILGRVRLTTGGGTNIIVTNGYSLKLEGFVITNNTVGAYFKNGNNSSLKYNIWQGNVYASIFYNSDNLIVYSNTMRNNYRNISMARTKNSRIGHNTIYNSSTLGANGITIASNYNIVSITNNEIYSLQGTGIVVLDIINSTIKANKVYKNLYNGLYIRGDTRPATNNYILNNQFYSNLMTGLRLDGTNYHNFVMNNIIYGNTNGAVSDYIRTTYFSNNNIYNNIILGFAVTGTSVSNTLTENRINNNRVGFFCDGINANYNIIRKNYFTKNQNFGIVIQTNCAYNQILNNYIISGSTNAIILYQNNDNTIIQNNNIGTNKNGIIVYSIPGSESENLVIKNNQIYQSGNSGIFLRQVWNSIVSNNRASDGNFGIYLLTSKNVTLDRQYCINNLTNGLTLDQVNQSIVKNGSFYYNNQGVQILTSTNVKLLNNSITNNDFGVTLLSLSLSNTITNNIISKQNKAGILIDNSTYNKFFNNNISHNSNGMEFMNAGVNNNIAMYNQITHNTNGVHYTSMNVNDIILNMIATNRYGINIDSGGVFAITLNKNNINNNQSTNLINSCTLPIVVGTNWFGTTIITNIEKSIGEAWPVDYIPYRLFGPYDIREGQDTDTPGSLLGFTATVTNDYQVKLTWNQSGAGDFSRYFIYRSRESSYSNLSRSSVAIVTTTTNYIDSPGGGDFTYHVTALDSASPYTNESWYSTNRSVIVTGYVHATNLYTGNAWNKTSLRHAPQTNIELLGFKITNATYTNITLSKVSIRLIYTNFAADTDFTNFILYRDSLTLGSLEALDVSIITDIAPSGGRIVFTNISGLTLPKNTSQNFLITFTHKTMTNLEGLRASLSNNFSIQYSIASTTITNFARGSGIGRMKYVSEPVAYFLITHQTNYDLGKWGPVSIQAFATNDGSPGYPLQYGYNGTITIQVTGTGSTIDWTNLSGAGTFTTNAIGGATYAFVPTDLGLVNLQIRNYTAETLNVNVQDGGIRDTDTEGLLYFFPYNPYIISINAPNKGYLTVAELNSLTITFYNILRSDSVISNINFYDKDNNKMNVLFTFVTNTNNNFPRTIVTINPGLLDTDILKQYWIEIKTNIQSTNNYYLINNPFNTSFNVPYYSVYTTLVADDVGGIVNTLDNSVTIVIDKNVLPDDAYVNIKNTTPAENSKISDANSKIGNNRFIRIIRDYNTYKDITAFNRNLQNISSLLNNAVLYITYPDTDNNGRVDNTDVDETRLKLFYLNEEKNEWEVIDDSSPDILNNRVRGNIKHFSIFCLMGYLESKDFDTSFLTYPNPANINLYTVKIKFYLEKDAKISIKIYTVTGEFVRDLMRDTVLPGGIMYDNSRAITWDGKNDRGVTVVNGVYLIKIKGNYTDGSGTFEKTWKQGIIK